MQRPNTSEQAPMEEAEAEHDEGAIGRAPSRLKCGYYALLVLTICAFGYLFAAFHYSALGFIDWSEARATDAYPSIDELLDQFGDFEARRNELLAYGAFLDDWGGTYFEYCGPSIPPNHPALDAFVDFRRALVILMLLAFVSGVLRSITNPFDAIGRDQSKLRNAIPVAKFLLGMSIVVAMWVYGTSAHLFLYIAFAEACSIGSSSGPLLLELLYLISVLVFAFVTGTQAPRFISVIGERIA